MSRQLTREQEDYIVSKLGKVTQSADFAIVRAILEKGDMEDGDYLLSTRELCLFARCTPQTVYKRIRRLEALGLLKRKNDDRLGQTARYEVFI